MRRFLFYVLPVRSYRKWQKEIVETAVTVHWWAVEGTFCGIVAEEPLVYKGEDGYARYLIDLRKIRYADGEEKKHFRNSVPV